MLPSRKFRSPFFGSINIMKKITKEFWAKHVYQIKYVYQNNIQKNNHVYYFDVFIVDFEKFFFRNTKTKMKTSIYFKEKSTWLK